MFIRNARSHRPVSLIFIPLIAVGLWLPGFLHPAPPAPMIFMPAFGSVASWTSAWPVLNVFLGLAFTLLQAFLLNYIAQQQQLFTRKTWLPALMFVTFASCTPSLLTFNPELVAGLFLLGALYVLLSTYRMDRAHSQVFNAGFLIGLAGIFYLPSLVFFIFAIIAIIVLRPFVWREWAILFAGLLVPWIYSGVYFFWNDRIVSVTMENIYNPVVQRDFFFKLPVEYYALAFMTGMVLLTSAGRFVAGAGTSTMKTKKGVSVMVWFLVFSIIAVIPAQNFAVPVFLFTVYPLSVFTSNYFLNARRQWLADTIYLFFLASIAATYFIKVSGLFGS
ncbi:MAG TPA: DUF6427 family protein [Bacteroidia bacterium]|nr:DUF6427 family protein [Bacteroidia bacterium]